MTMHLLGHVHVDFAHVESALAKAILHTSRVQRRDHAGVIPVGGEIDAYARHCDGLALRELGAGKWTPPPEMIADARRADALPAGAGSAPRDLEYVRTQVLEEKLPAMNAERLFPADNEVPLGATSHVMQRWVTDGEAQVFRGGSSIPMASAGKVEERFGVAYVVCGVQMNFFQALSVNYANLRTFQAESAAAMRLVKERVERILWGGDVATQLYGVLNYPHLAKEVIGTKFDGTATGPAVVAALANLVGEPRIVSKQVFSPNRLAVSETVHQYLTETQFAAGTDTTIAEFFLKGQAGKPNGIKAIEAVHELEADSEWMTKAGAPTGLHGILAFRDDTASVRRVVIQEPTWLPIYQSSPLDQTHVIFAATGGIVMPDVGNATLGFADAG